MIAKISFDIAENGPREVCLGLVSPDLGSFLSYRYTEAMPLLLAQRSKAAGRIHWADMALPGDAMLLGGPMVGVISRCMSGRMKGIDLTTAGCTTQTH